MPRMLHHLGKEKGKAVYFSFTEFDVGQKKSTSGCDTEDCPDFGRGKNGRE